MKTINRVISIIDHGIVLFLRLIKRLVKKIFYHHYGLHPQASMITNKYIITNDAIPCTNIKAKKKCHAIYIFADESKIKKNKSSS